MVKCLTISYFNFLDNCTTQIKKKHYIYTIPTYHGLWFILYFFYTFGLVWVKFIAQKKQK